MTVVNASDILDNNKFANAGHLVDKSDTLIYDLGNLCAFDHSSINIVSYKANAKEYIDNLATENVQLLVSRLFQLPLKTIDEGTLALLPKCTTPIPRERALPESKPKTRWEAFAEIKGIKKKKKSRMEWDKKEEEFRPTYGYKRANDETAVWEMNAKPTDKVGDDPFQKMIDEKNDKLSKQKQREQRNFDESSMRQMGSVGKSLDFSKDKRAQLKSDLDHTFDVAKLATASLGKFDKQVENEKALPKRGKKKLAGLGAGDVSQESENATKLVDRMFKKENVLNVDKAVRQHVKAEEKQNYIKKRSGSFSKGGPNKKSKSK
ncbi:hypothetical protein CYY_001085 [Polysphondylium violaceum]|uniref:Ribosome biogenesis regulatory protein n=1 Tax=Polysphondylium violaceum TaxID=133409 RepID=A0A8J4Q3Q9_9MYCE|nr:hypothetical protein CYY_001085 [Polysphondylium violaceum]